MDNSLSCKKSARACTVFVLNSLEVFVGLGTTELIILLVVALIIFGPSRLPGLGKSMGEAIRGFKKGMEEKSDESEKREQIVSSDTTKSKAEEKDKDKV